MKPVAHRMQPRGGRLVRLVLQAVDLQVARRERPVD